MPYIADENENNFSKNDWIGYVVLALAIFAIGFAVYSCIYGPKVTPPTHMKTADPYWFGGE